MKSATADPIIGNFVSLSAVVNANNRFLCILAQRVPDIAISKLPSLHWLLEENKLKIAAPQCMSKAQHRVSYFTADEAFPFMQNVMKPYSNQYIPWWKNQ